jgi:hypothetical protein
LYSYRPILATRWCGKNLLPKSSFAKIRQFEKNSLELNNCFYGLIVYSNIIFSYLINSSFIFIYSSNTKKFKSFLMFERKFFNLNINLPIIEALIISEEHKLAASCAELKAQFWLFLSL